MRVTSVVFRWTEARIDTAQTDARTSVATGVELVTCDVLYDTCKVKIFTRICKNFKP